MRHRVQITYNMYGQGLLPWNNTQDAFDEALQTLLEDSSDVFTFDEAVYAGSVVCSY